MTRCVFIAGTHGLSGTRTTGGWHQWPSPFLTFMESNGVVPYSKYHGFEWDTRLGLWGDRKLTGWYTAGLALHDHFHAPHQGSCDDVTEVNAVAHSHGLQVCAFAASAGLKFRTLISVCSPPRKDMAGMYDVLRASCRTWVHVHTGWRDTWQWLGTIGDRAFGIERQMARAHVNIEVPGIGHGDLVTNPRTWHWWGAAGLLGYLRGQS